jgi:NTP pyrophosphatase (non-canonical NTP hydrolase)
MTHHITKQQHVAAFMTAMDQVFDASKEDEIIRLRQRLIMEEAGEVYDELERPVLNKVALTKELADLLYVVYGTAEQLNLPLEPAFNRVHASNMSKLDDNGKPLYREDGKVLKGPNYEKPNLDDLF